MHDFALESIAPQRPRSGWTDSSSLPTALGVRAAVALGSNHPQQLSAAADERLELLALGVGQRTRWRAYTFGEQGQSICDHGQFIGKVAEFLQAVRGHQEISLRQ